jgi:dCMP deaminase
MSTAGDPDGCSVRPSWEEYFMEIARVVSTRSSCLRRQVGAVVVKNRQILATGYNGVPRGLRHCDQVGCLRDQLGIPSGERHELCRGLHAEQNAIIQAAYHGIAINGSEIYSTLQPCVNCAKTLVNAGVLAVHFCGAYPDALSMEIFEEAGTLLHRMG